LNEKLDNLWLAILREWPEISGWAMGRVSAISAAARSLSVFS
jgi:hypothetical protein